MDHPKPWLRYVDAEELESTSVNFDHLNVESSSGDKLGEIDGFIVDSSSGRPYYVAVDTGGWFKSKLFLLPIGHTSFDPNRKRLVADLTRDRVNQFPGFNRREFERLSDDELRHMDEQIVRACCPTQVLEEPSSRFERWTHYQSPTWWQSDFYRPDRADRIAHSVAGGAAPPRGTPARGRREREAVVAKAGDVSPHAEGRAQPGDVIGVETGGERTHVGETSEDENKRRRDAERAGTTKRR